MSRPSWTYRKIFSTLRAFALLAFAVWCTRSLFELLEAGSERQTRAAAARAYPELASGATKTILYYTKFFGRDTYFFGTGSEPFRAANCAVSDCYATTDRRWMPVDEFDAVLFHGPDYSGDRIAWPPRRKPRQRYVFFSMESPAMVPSSKALPSGFFNTTMTYSLESDVRIYYLSFHDALGDRVAPADDPKWKRHPTISERTFAKYARLHARKSKAVAWFVSHCDTPNKRERLAKDLGKHVRVDVYGSCGPLKCSVDDEDKCVNMLRADYFFYLGFENSNCVDYVTEKAATAYNADAVPIVYGGANYSKFLPPASYIDASTMSVEELGALLKRLMADAEAWAKYFWWRDAYELRASNTKQSFCELCALLHRDPPAKSYDMASWWRPAGFGGKCKKVG